MVWPPISLEEEYRALVERLEWFLPKRAPPLSVGISVRGSAEKTAHAPGDSDSPEGLIGVRFQPLSYRAPKGNALAGAQALLVWKLLHPANLTAMRRLRRWYLIDSDWYSLVEELEWTLLYAEFRDPQESGRLDLISRTNFERLQSLARKDRIINVCGNGPSLSASLESGRLHGLSIVCNTAVQSDRVLGALKPAVVAFANSVFFGPSQFARRLMESAWRCVQEYGAMVVVPGGYAHHLVAENYPNLRAHTIGLHFVDKPSIPDAQHLVTGRSSNVATALMLPLAAAVRPDVIRVWGCDGGPVEQRSRWSPWQYFAGGEPDRDDAIQMHPAFFRDRTVTKDYYARIYTDHCRYMESLLALIEGMGLPVKNCSPSHIAALQRRYQAP